VSRRSISSLGHWKMSKLVYVEWDADGRISRVIRETLLDDSKLNAADRIVNALDRPHQLTQFDVDWCNRDQCYYGHCSGHWSGRVYLNRHVNGHRSTFWAASHVQFCDDSCSSREIFSEQITERGYDRVILLNTPEDITRTCEEENCYWCSICEDTLPDNEPCEHASFCEPCGVLNTPGDTCAH
jgi:hypothetical protein